MEDPELDEDPELEDEPEFDEGPEFEDDPELDDEPELEDEPEFDDEPELDEPPLSSLCVSSPPRDIRILGVLLSAANPRCASGSPAVSKTAGRRRVVLSRMIQ